MSTSTSELIGASVRRIDALEKVNSGEASRMRGVAEGPGAQEGAPPAPGTREKA